MVREGEHGMPGPIGAVAARVTTLVEHTEDTTVRLQVDNIESRVVDLGSVRGMTHESLDSVHHGERWGVPR